MPIYTFVNDETGDEFEKVLSMSELDVYLKKNPVIRQKLTTPMIIDPTRLGVTKPDAGMQELLNHAKSSHLHSTIKTTPH